MLALQGSGPEAALDRAWKLLGSWQRPDGSFQPSGGVKEGTWVTAHAVTLASVRGVDDPAIQKAVDWLLEVVGAEHSIPMRAFSKLHLLQTKLDVSHQGWPWRDGNASWIEPTAHTLVALRKVAKNYRRAEIAHRIQEGEKLVLSRRCADGGWNCGNPNVFNYDLPSYPETTGLALIGLENLGDSGSRDAFNVARRFRAETKSSLAKAWLQIALRCHGQDVEAPPEIGFASRDIMLGSIEALGHPQGNYRLFRAGGQA